MHRPVAGSSARGLLQPGQAAFAAAWPSARVHRKHSTRSRYPTGAPHRAQSRCRLPTAGPYSGGMDRPRGEPAASLAGLAACGAVPATGLDGVTVTVTVGSVLSKGRREAASKAASKSKLG